MLVESMADADEPPGTGQDSTVNLETPVFLRAPFVEWGHVADTSRQLAPKFEDYKAGGYLWHYHWLYRYFDPDGALLYIGIAGNFGERDDAHLRRSEWRWKYAVSATLETYP